MPKEERKKWNGLIRGVKVLCFGGMLTVMCVIGLLWFLRPETSVVEKRSLTRFPDFTWSSFWDGSFFKGIDTWYADTYPLREGLIAGSQAMAERYGLRKDQIVGETITADEIPDDPNALAAEPVSQFQEEPDTPLEDGTVTELGELQGQIYITNNSGYGLYYFSQEGADAFASMMNQVYANVKDQVNLYVMICPISAGVMLDQSVLDDMKCSNERDAIEYVYGRMEEGIHTVSAFDRLKKHNAEYIYFHTDHHWTALGAYYAYVEFCKEKGLAAHKVEDYETLTLPGFLGTFYSSSNNSPALRDNPDTVIGYLPKGTNTMMMSDKEGNMNQWKIVNDVSSYPKSELYAAFAGGDKAFSYAHNETITDGSAVMVVKDSFGNAFIPWLVDHYEYVYWVDVRYTSNTISQMVADYGVTDVIYQCQIYNATTKNLLSKYAAIGK